jgi:hypothetical protein
VNGRRRNLLSLRTRIVLLTHGASSPPAGSPSRVIGDGQLGQGLLQVSARIGYVLCHRARPSPQIPGDHPVRPSFTKPQISDSTSYPRHFADHRQAAFRPAPVSGRRARLPAAPRATSSGRPASRTASDAGAHRSLCGWLPRTATLALSQAGSRHRVPPHGGKPEGFRTAPSAVRRFPQARPQSGEDLPTGRLRRRRRRCRWRAGPGCRVPVMAESGIRTLRIPSPHRGGSHGSRPGHGGRQLAASRCTLETGEGSDGRQPHRRRGTARRHAADLG